MKNNRKGKNERTNTSAKDKSQLYLNPNNQNKGNNKKYDKLNLNILNGKKNSAKFQNLNRKSSKYVTSL